MTCINQRPLIGLFTVGYLAVISIGITGCGTSHVDNYQSNNMSMTISPSSQSMATVKMTVPKKTTIGTTERLSVLVTQQGKPVNQVDDVMFEIWKDTPNAKHEIIHAKHTGEGTFSIDYIFKEVGTYDVLYHVVAQGNMIMTAPQKVTVSR